MSFAQWFGAVKGEKRSVAAPESNPSLPGGRRVRGYTISRLPFGAYLQALEKLQSLPGDLLRACFPGKDADEILMALKNLDEGALVQLIAGAAGAGAPYLLELISDFSGIPQDELREAFRRDSHEYWAAAAQREQRARASGEGLAAVWKRQEGKLHPLMQPHRPKIGSGTTHQRLDLPELPDNQARFAALLRSFSEVRENRHVNDTDFSYAWYMYGLEHYDGMPLIEPLEYSEERKLREMVIVLDTSASCSRGLCAWFLSAVRDILCRERLFFEQFRLHILQCDCEVQQDALVTNLDEFQWYLEHLELYGGGGTDFRPAFRHVDRLIEEGKLERLGGVLYFTDGYGVFPEEAPPYPVTFVMLQYRCDDINIPRWAKTLVLDAEKPGSEEQWI